MTTLTQPKLGPSQISVLNVLKSYSTGLTAPSVRDEAGLPEGDYGTRRAHAILGRLVDLGFASKEEMSQKVAAKYVNEKTGRSAAHRFKITADGKKALKSST
jgi:hypothetical protein